MSVLRGGSAAGAAALAAELAAHAAREAERRAAHARMLERADEERAAREDRRLAGMSSRQLLAEGMRRAGVIRPR